ncbi:MAG: hypothetical protein GY788_02050 [bacterium]|nr:hypothetical protein [bacterium]
MGISVDFDIPRWSTSAGRTSSPLLSRSKVDSEAHAEEFRNRLLITVFVADREQVLETLLGALDDGVELGLRFPVRFSLDGSLAAVLMGAGAVALVVHPHVDDASDWPDEEDDNLHRLLAQRLRRIASLPEKSIEVVSLSGLGNSVFDERSRFTEYRFLAHGDSLERLGDVARDFSAALGEQHIPIAYLYFPDRWRSVSPDAKSLRIGVGLPDSTTDIVSSSASVDLAAIRVAQRHECELRKYDPAIDLPSMSSRFRTILERRSELAATHMPDYLDVVFLAADADWGLVGSWLGAIGTPVLGGSMTVLAGRTVSTWVVQGGTGQSVLDAVMLSDKDEYKPAQSRLIEGIDLHDRDVDLRHLWVAWRCQDTPGVLRRLLSSVREFLTEAGVDLAGVDYEISRVLKDATTCAGKVRLLVGDEVDIPSLRERLLEVLEPSLLSWTPSDESWKAHPVVVEEREPAEAPWATLAVG